MGFIYLKIPLCFFGRFKKLIVRRKLQIVKSSSQEKRVIESRVNENLLYTNKTLEFTNKGTFIYLFFRKNWFLALSYVCVSKSFYLAPQILVYLALHFNLFTRWIQQTTRFQYFEWGFYPFEYSFGIFSALSMYDLAPFQFFRFQKKKYFFYLTSSRRLESVFDINLVPNIAFFI